MGSRRRERRRLPKPGLPPGTLTVDPSAAPTLIRCFGYSPDAFEEVTITDPAEFVPLMARWPSLWVDVEGLGNAETLRTVAEAFKLHPLAMEDVTDTSQRAKVEPYGDEVFIVVPMPHVNTDGFTTEQLSIFLGPGWVVTFQESSPGDSLGQIRDRIRYKRGRVRTSPPAYLAYALVDAVIDGYFPVIERLGDQLDELEHEVLDDPNHKQVLELRRIKRELARLRRAIWPMRDATTTMISLDTLFTPELRLYVRDAYDHVVRLMDIVETDRSMASDLMEIHLSAVSARLGEVNKFLTVIATIFLPLSWIAGVYGMNFKFMPELDWRLGYPLALLVMVLFAAGLLLYFKRNGWLAPSVFGSRRSRAQASERATGASTSAHSPTSTTPHSTR